ncbi:restriction endonuclease [soil metagenome]
MTEEANSRALPSHMQKGNIIERIVGELHEDPSVRVQSKVFRQSVRDPKHRREIDVLVTGWVLGQERHIAFECKNYGKRVGPGRIGEFADRLRQVGIPPQHGIFVVSREGYTEGARSNAADHGIRLFLLDGLSEDRLSTEVFDAFQSVTYLALSITQITVSTETDFGQLSAMETHFFKDHSGRVCGTIMDLIWADWRDNRIPASIGTHKVTVKVPEGWKWIIRGMEVTFTVTSDVEVRAYVITHKGSAERIRLVDATTGDVEKVRVHANFDLAPGTYPLAVARTEQELIEILSRPAVARIDHARIRLPRILYDFYWPPSSRVFKLLMEESHELFMTGKLASGVFETKSRAELEGTNLSVLWEPIWPGHPSINRPLWPWDTVTRSGRVRKRANRNRDRK